MTSHESSSFSASGFASEDNATASNKLQKIDIDAVDSSFDQQETRIVYLNNSTMSIESSRVVSINEISDIDCMEEDEEAEEEDKYVYSIHLNSNHNYFINNGILVHNSYEIYVKTLAENLILIDVDNTVRGREIDKVTRRCNLPRSCRNFAPKSCLT